MARAIGGGPAKAYKEKMPMRAPEPYNPALASTIGSVAGNVGELAKYDWASLGK
jgi:hypothetical protein